jgi:NTE family protein
MKKLKIGLVLGGGGARGLAHIGVLKALQKQGIHIDVITGTSMGALVAAVYAQHPDADYVEQRFQDLINNEKFTFLGGDYFQQKSQYEPEDLLHQISREIKRRVIINLAAQRQGLIKHERMELAVSELVDDGLIDNTEIPYACAAVDLLTGNEVIFYSGEIRQAIAASSAIPGFLPPVQYKDYQLVDGSVCVNFPIDAAKKLGADIVIASNVSLALDAGPKAENVIDIIIRANSAATQKINRLTLKEADFVLKPPIGAIQWSEFSRIDSLIEYGINETNNQIEKIKEIIVNKYSLTSRIKLYILNLIRKILRVT